MSVALAATTIVVAAGTAYAASSGSIPTINSGGVAFTSGSYLFDPWPCNSTCYLGKYSGFNYYGTLTDTAADGHDVFIHAKPDGYGYGARDYTSGGKGHTRSIAKRVVDNNGDPVQQGMVQACVDKGTLVPDYCVAKGWFYR